MTTRIYDSNRVEVSFAGVPMQGYADGEFLTITFEEDTFSKVTGTDGEASRSKSNNLGCTMEVRLMSTSPTNLLLSAIHEADKNANGGAGVGAFFVADLNGTTEFLAGNAWIVKAPDQNFDREATERVWTFTCDRGNAIVGGTL